MNEICAILYYVFMQEKQDDPLINEADCFFCFSLIMTDLKEAFVKTFDDDKGGIKDKIQMLLFIESF
ncbi:hypothetical protein IMG5_167930 [Ichthyophthirius multifiliis]|uniref:Uncharacterized protein n=1 Tax=Ichthyophthirius multifiliis TaxID=5932 RepID=G0R110_ICHMU|nr:hypothetical protein IMG5_167930 [Ichthyophthirius multifiliis]EGR28841.1 hypothetical protein IMG5_167930 [Ichthyophthirius multifiliis]|eukprot:XP_004030077.1 hypothetical protein IMG5_167930 [Ichthyophthirius multifiliis]